MHMSITSFIVCESIVIYDIVPSVMPFFKTCQIDRVMPIMELVRKTVVSYYRLGMNLL